MKEPAKEGVIIHYMTSPLSGSVDEIENGYNIYVYANKRVKYGYDNDVKLKTLKLSDEEYNELIEFAFSSKIIGLKEDISDDVLDGSESYVVLYFDDDTEFKTGGLNPSSKNFNKLIPC